MNKNKNKKESFFYKIAAMGIPLRSNEKKLREYKNIYIGKRVFVIGNGPSLNNTDLSKIIGEVTIGCNGLFLLFEEMGYLPTFYTVEDRLVAEDRARTINNIKGTTKIFPFDLSSFLHKDEDTLYVNFLRNYEDFPKLTDDFVDKVFWGGTVTMLNIQLAYYLGAQEVYLVGIDHSYGQPKNKDEVKGPVIKSNNPDENHFHPDYFGPGFRYHDPKVERMEEAYVEARNFFERNNRNIVNATVGGKLEVFPRVNFDDLFGDQDE